MAILTYDSLSVSYGGKQVLHNVNFSLEKGEILAVVGVSGSGKSTLLKAALACGGTVTGGHIYYHDTDLSSLSKREMQKIAGAKIGMIFQDAGASFCPVRTIGQQMYESMRAHEKINRREAKERALDLFAELHLKDAERIWDSYPFELSGGMMQRIGIAMGMLLQPDVLLADEVTSALDVISQKQVMEEMVSLCRSCGTAMILVTHDIGVAAKTADRMLVLHEDRVKEYGRTMDVLHHPAAEYTKRLLSAVPHFRRTV